MVVEAVTKIEKRMDKIKGKRWNKEEEWEEAMQMRNNSTNG